MSDERWSDETKIEGGIEWFAGEDKDGAEIDRCQCARCGSSAEFAMCTRCGGDGVMDAEDGGAGADWPDYARVCPDCRGECGSWHCVSSPEHCKANPLPGREHIESTAMSSEAWSDCL